MSFTRVGFSMMVLSFVEASVPEMKYINSLQITLVFPPPQKKYRNHSNFTLDMNLAHRYLLPIVCDMFTNNFGFSISYSFQKLNKNWQNGLITTCTKHQTQLAVNYLPGFIHFFLRCFSCRAACSHRGNKSECPSCIPWV